MFSVVGESRGLEYPFASPAEIYLPASLHLSPYMERNDLALGTQWHTHQQISFIAEVG